MRMPPTIIIERLIASYVERAVSSGGIKPAGIRVAPGNAAPNANSMAIVMKRRRNDQMKNGE